jgi:hypothetical protein
MCERSMVGLSDACTFSQSGERSDKPHFPFEVHFEPTAAVHFADAHKTNDQLLAELASIGAGTPLFDVYAFASPDAKAQRTRLALGTMSTSSACHQTEWGDGQLFFRHQRMEVRIPTPRRGSRVCTLLMV